MKKGASPFTAKPADFRRVAVTGVVDYLGAMSHEAVTAAVAEGDGWTAHVAAIPGVETDAEAGARQRAATSSMPAFDREMRRTRGAP